MIFIPKERSGYYFINRVGNITYKINHNTVDDIHLIKSGNCYRTEEDAARARDKSYAKRELEVLADELNSGVEIDWKNQEQRKYCIYLFKENQGIYLKETGIVKNQGTIYSLSPNFLEEALKRLGEDKLRLILEVE